MTENKPKNDIFRGSGWESHRRPVSSAYRYNPVPGNRYGNIGIRLVEVVDDPAPVAASSGSNRVDRGGCWYYVPRNARVANRFYYSPGYRFRDLGLRLVEVTDDPTPDPAPSGSDRVDRGGGWYDDPQYARVANRYYNTPGYRYYSLGVRLVEVVLEEE